ncbi:MAG: hypothetical protein U0807_10605 [Candidatus Binatia bacterium]
MIALVPLLLLALLPTASVASATAWQDAAGRIGEIVTVEGDVAQAVTSGSTCTLEFVPAGELHFHAVLLVPLISDLPRAPDRLYRGRRVRVTGKLKRFHDQLEIVLTDPGLLEVVDVVAVSPPTPEPVPPPTPAPLATVPVEPGVEPEAPPAPRGLIEAVAPQLAQDPCDRARTRWRDAAAAARTRSEAFSRCLAAGGYRCRAESAGLAPALSALEWAEQQLDDACP